MEDILIELAGCFKTLREDVLPSKKWKFYKFGRGGPFRVLLTDLQKSSVLYDEKIQKHFLVDKKNYASFTRLIQVCLANHSPVKLYKELNTIDRQIKLMQRFIHCDMEGKI